MLRIVLSCAALASVVAGCAPFSQTETRPQQAAENTVCMQVMEIWTGDVYYPRCQEAVGYILTAKSERQAVVTGYKECTQQGFSEGSAGFSSCTEDFKSKAPAPVPLAIAYPGGPDTEPGIRFDYVSPKIQLNREQYACGQLGFLPGSGPYGDCVASLEDALIPNKY